MQREDVRSIHDCERYAQEHGYDSVRFRVARAGGEYGATIYRWGDAYMGIIVIDQMENLGFMRAGTLQLAFGSDFTCQIVEEKEI